MGAQSSREEARWEETDREEENFGGWEGSDGEKAKG